MSLDALKHSLLEDLNPPQREAVQHTEGPLLILAGAGSGKTRALVRKMDWLVKVKGMSPMQILALTFTNKAAKEMRDRAGKSLGRDAEALWLGTFHSVGVRILRLHGHYLGLDRNFVIFDSDDQQTMLKRVLQKMNLDKESWPPKVIANYINKQKQVCRGPDSPSLPRTTLHDQTLAMIYGVYQGAMKEAGAVDFADLIWLSWRLVSEIELVRHDLHTRFRYILVDEFQDTNHAQLLLLKALLSPHASLCVVGDDDQSIYGWRGAEIKHILQFGKNFDNAHTIRFEQNYRSNKAILEVSGAVIRENHGRHPKTLFTDKNSSNKVKTYEAYSDLDEAEFVAGKVKQLKDRGIPLSQMAIIYRTNAQSRPFEDKLRQRQLAHKVYGGLRFYDRSEIKDLLAYLRLVANPLDPVGLERVINRPQRGIGTVSVNKINERAEKEGLSLWEAVVESAKEGGATGNKLQAFVDLMITLKESAENDSVFSLTRTLLQKTQYLAWLTRDGSVESETRAENVKEFLNSVAEFSEREEDPSLQSFLDSVALVNPLDEEQDEDAVVMMTAHMAKGLEFEVVFVTGIEQELLPHYNSLEDPQKIEEERRLFYVAMTRAKEELFLTWAGQRRRFGHIRQSEPSIFLEALPLQYIEVEHSNSSYSGASLYDRNRQSPFSNRGSGDFQKTLAQSPMTPSPSYSASPAYEDMSQVTYDGDSSDSWSAGMRAFHPKFGEGLVVKVEGEGLKAKVSVRFWDGITRKLVARVLNEL